MYIWPCSRLQAMHCIATSKSADEIWLSSLSDLVVTMLVKARRRLRCAHGSGDHRLMRRRSRFVRRERADAIPFHVTKLERSFTVETSVPAHLKTCAVLDGNSIRPTLDSLFLSWRLPPEKSYCFHTVARYASHLSPLQTA